MFSSRTNWPSEPNRISKALFVAMSRGHRPLDLTVSNPTKANFHYRPPETKTQFVLYSPDAKGGNVPREAIATYYAQQPHRVTIDVGSTFVVAGTSEAYSYIFRLLCNAGDEIMIGAPGYPLLDILADICDVKLVQFHLLYDHGWHIDFHDLEQKVTPRTRAIVLVHPNNPTGSYVKPAERERLDQICLARSLGLIVDEVFLDYPVEVGPQPSFADNASILTFTLSGISKIAGRPEMKAAWFHVSGPAAERDEAVRRLEIIADTFLSTSIPTQMALPAILETRKGFQDQLHERIRMNLTELDARMKGHACSRLPVEGGWYVTLRVPQLQSDEDLVIDLLEKDGVIVESGHFFDFPSDGYLVLSLMTLPDVFIEGIGKILARF